MSTKSKKYYQGLVPKELEKLVGELRENLQQKEAHINELRQTLNSKDHALKKYADHYDFAPVGYLSLDEAGGIQEINLTGCQLLGEERHNIIGEPVTKFLDPSSYEAFQRHIDHIFQNGKKDFCQVKINYRGVAYSIELKSIAVEDDAGHTYCRSTMYNISGKLETEAELDEQRKLMAAVFEHSESGILVCDHKGFITLANKAAYNLFGPGLAGLNVNEWSNHLRLFKGDLTTLLKKEELPLYKACRGERVQDTEVYHISKSGEKRMLLANGQPIYNRQGLKLGGVIALYDITDRKKNEEELRTYRQQLEKLVEERTVELKSANNQLYEEIAERTNTQRKYLIEKQFVESLINSHPGLFFLIDKQGRIHRWNKNMELYSGYDKEEIKNMKAFNLLDEKDIEITRFRLDTAFQQGQAMGKARLVTKQKERIPFLLSGVSVSLAGEDYVIGTGIDISAREKDRAEKMTFFQVLEKSMNEIYIFDASTCKFLYVNEGARRNLGYAQDELMEMKAFQIKPGVHENDFLEIIKPLLTMEQEKVTISSVHQRKDGSTYPVEIHLQLIEQEDEKVFIAIARDITERLHAEELVKSALMEKEVLLKEIHHRVKNNLSIVSSLLFIQAGYTSDLFIKKLFIESESRVKSMALIHEMLYQQESFSRIEYRPYINKLIKHISSNFHITGATIHTVINIDNIFLDIKTAVPCALIINELLTNAYKHAFKDRPEGTIQIGISYIGKMIELIVEDDGVGLPPDILDKDTLGMTLVSGLTSQVKGDIDIGGDNGARFVIRFPHTR